MTAYIVGGRRVDTFGTSENDQAREAGRSRGQRRIAALRYHEENIDTVNPVARAINTAMELLNSSDAPPTVIEQVVETVTVAATVRAIADNPIELTSSDIQLIIGFFEWAWLDYFRLRRR
ncbi:hypothetical protein [Rhodococcus sp. A14]|uniref:hypothetical protein n=1 Tax=Rhodococcus sp. A14 TaxID=1194106 RepID=UPI00141E0F53|nr:hypothetical protein [Rhodococcus sp. A14]